MRRALLHIHSQRWAFPPLLCALLAAMVPKNNKKGMCFPANCAICHPGHFSWRVGVLQAGPAAPPAPVQSVFVLPSPCSSHRWPGSSIFYQPLPPPKIPEAASLLLSSTYWNGKFTQSDFQPGRLKAESSAELTPAAAEPS